MKHLGMLACLLVLMVLLFSCSPDIIGTHTEGSDLTNDLTAESVNFTPAIGGWYQISGGYSTSDDSDKYLVMIPAGTSWIDFNVYHEGDKLANLLGISLYPFGFTTYDAADEVIKSYLLQAGVTSQDINSTAAYLVFSFHAGSGDWASGNYNVNFTFY